MFSRMIKACGLIVAHCGGARASLDDTLFPVPMHDNGPGVRVITGGGGRSRRDLMPAARPTPSCATARMGERLEHAFREYKPWVHEGRHLDGAPGSSFNLARPCLRTSGTSADQPGHLG